MRPMAWIKPASIKPMMAWALLIAMGIPPAIAAEELINRRDQARKAFLATPEGLYTHYCEPCHGEDATGAGRLWVSELPAEPADLTTLGADKEYVIAVIRDGSAVHGKSNLCPPWQRTISAANMERLAQYIVSLESPTSESETSEPATQAAASPEPVREPIPWFMLALLVGEIALLWAMLRQRKETSNVIP